MEETERITNDELWQLGLALRLLLISRVSFVIAVLAPILLAFSGAAADAIGLAATLALFLVYPALGLLQIGVVRYIRRKVPWCPQSGFRKLTTGGIFAGASAPLLLPFFLSPTTHYRVSAVLAAVALGACLPLALFRTERGIILFVRALNRHVSPAEDRPASGKRAFTDSCSCLGLLMLLALIWPLSWLSIAPMVSEYSISRGDVFIFAFTPMLFAAITAVNAVRLYLLVRRFNGITAENLQPD